MGVLPFKLCKNVSVSGADPSPPGRGPQIHARVADLGLRSKTAPSCTVMWSHLVGTTVAKVVPSRAPSNALCNHPDALAEMAHRPTPTPTARTPHSTIGAIRQQLRRQLRLIQNQCVQYSNFYYCNASIHHQAKDL